MSLAVPVAEVRRSWEQGQGLGGSWNRVGVSQGRGAARRLATDCPGQSSRTGQKLLALVGPHVGDGSGDLASIYAGIGNRRVDLSSQLSDIQRDRLIGNRISVEVSQIV